MPLKIKIEKQPPPPQATVELRVRKTLSGNLLITDHVKMDIVIVPKEKKIVSFPKPDAGDGVYEHQRDLMNSLFQGGVIDLDSVQGGPAYGVLEGVIGEGKGVDPIQVALLEVEKFIKKTMSEMIPAQVYDEYIEDRFTDPSDEDSTGLGEIPPEQDEPYRKSAGTPAYTFAGYGYLY
tara:strand:- start:304 stop:837 length:534 start_codon:yes stop_codon:yes gene_type:complete